MDTTTIEFKQFFVGLLATVATAAFVFVPYGSSDAISDLSGDTDVAKYTGVSAFIFSAVSLCIAFVRMKYKYNWLKMSLAFLVVATPTLLLCSFIAYEDSPKSEIPVPILLLLLSVYAYGAIAYSLTYEATKILSPLWSQFV